MPMPDLEPYERSAAFARDLFDLTQHLEPVADSARVTASVIAISLAHEHWHAVRSYHLTSNVDRFFNARMSGARIAHDASASRDAKPPTCGVCCVYDHKCVGVSVLTVWLRSNTHLPLIAIVTRGALYTIGVRSVLVITI